MMRIIACAICVACSTPAPRPATPTQADECRAVDAWQADFHEIDVYCNHVADRCCGGDGQWGCNNVNYIAWYGAYCRVL